MPTPSEILMQDRRQTEPTFAQIHYVLPPYPRQVRLETSSFCNSHCNFCQLHGEIGLLRKKGKMPMDLIRHIIDDVAEWPEPPKELVPTNFGELFLHRQWEEILWLIVDRLPNTAIKVVTTGTLFRDGDIERLAQVPTLTYVNVSLNAFFPETWTRILHQPPKNMARAINAIHHLRDRRPDIEVNVSMVHDPEIITEIERDMFEAYWKQFGATTISNVFFANHPRRHPTEPVTLPCRSLIDGLTIFDDGQVGTGCCLDGNAEPSLNLGHVPEDRLLDLWNGPRLRALVELHNSGRRTELPMCRTCSFA